MIMRLISIVAMTPGRLIGRDGRLPWHVPEDLRFFKRTTTGHAVIMGRKTYESMNRPLPNRRNIVITRQPSYMPQVRHTESADDTAAATPPVVKSTLDVVGSLDAAIELCRARKEPDAFIIGGAQIYSAAMDRVDEMIITKIEGDYEGDTFFPEWPAEEWVDAGPVDPAFPAATRYVRRAGAKG